MDVGELIKQKRKEANMTQEDLGRLVGVNGAAINKWETGRVTNLKRDTIKRLSEIFNVSPSIFVDPNNVVNSAFNTINGNNNIIGNGNTVEKSLSEQETVLLEMFRKMDVVKQAQLISFAAELIKKNV